MKKLPILPAKAFYWRASQKRETSKQRSKEQEEKTRMTTERQREREKGNMTAGKKQIKDKGSIPRSSQPACGGPPMAGYVKILRCDDSVL